MAALENPVLVAVTALVDRLAQDQDHARKVPARPDRSLEELGIGSLRLVELIAELESAYGFQFRHDDIDVANFATLADVTNLVDRYLNSPGAWPPRTPPGGAAVPAPVSAAVPAPGGGLAGAGEGLPADFPALPADARLLLCTAKLRMTAADVGIATDLLRKKAVDCGRFLDLAAKHRVLNLVARSFARERLELTDIVPHWTMRSSYLYNRQRNLALVDELGVLLAEFASRGVNAVVRKGTYLTCRVYPDPALRFSADLDLYVADSDRVAFSRAMTDLGYQQGLPTENGRVMLPLDREEAIFSRLHEAALPPFRRLTSDPYVEIFTIDPSHNLMPPASHKSIPAADFLRRAHRETVAGEQAWVCSPEDTLLDLCVHLFREATSVCSIELNKDLCLIRFIDIVQWWRAAGGRLDTERFAGLAAQYDLVAENYYALHFTQLLYPGVVPPELLDRLRPDDLDYLDTYGFYEGLPGRWDVPFMERMFDPDHGAGITVG
ncbi:MAG TPA: nucleotidyltransferase family protein [Streptosporangiaceae bacterium]|nr:nucleotidyltransferase family protein [Streptosporangiaceae bacterium]